MKVRAENRHLRQAATRWNAIHLRWSKVASFAYGKLSPLCRVAFQRCAWPNFLTAGFVDCVQQNAWLKFDSMKKNTGIQNFASLILSSLFFHRTSSSAALSLSVKRQRQWTNWTTEIKSQPHIQVHLLAPTHRRPLRKQKSLNFANAPRPHNAERKSNTFRTFKRSWQLDWP